MTQRLNPIFLLAAILFSLLMAALVSGCARLDGQGLYLVAAVIVVLLLGYLLAVLLRPDDFS